MNFGTKKEFNSFQKKDEPVKQYKNVYVDWKLMEVDEDAILPHGRYAGETLEYVMENDDNYYLWMVKNSLIGNWGLVRLKQQKKKQTMKDYYVNDLGEVYIGICEYPGNGIKSIYL